MEALADFFCSGIDKQACELHKTRDVYTKLRQKKIDAFKNFNLQYTFLFINVIY